MFRHLTLAATLRSKDPALAEAHQAAIERMKAAGFEQGKAYDVGPDDEVREIELDADER